MLIESCSPVGHPRPGTHAGPCGEVQTDGEPEFSPKTHWWYFWQSKHVLTCSSGTQMMIPALWTPHFPPNKGMILPTLLVVMGLRSPASQASARGLALGQCLLQGRCPTCSQTAYPPPVPQSHVIDALIRDEGASILCWIQHPSSLLVCGGSFKDRLPTDRGLFLLPRLLVTPRAV